MVSGGERCIDATISQMSMEHNEVTDYYEVEWAENPLATIIRLTDEGRLRLKLGIAIDGIHEARVLFKLIREQNDIKWADKFDPPEDVEAWIDEWAKSCEQGLHEQHCGDCTHVPMTCVKCLAENRLGFCTISGLGGAEGSAIQAAFSGGDCMTIDEAIAYLNGPISASWEGWEAHLPRWRAEHDSAARWLQTYKELHRNDVA